LGIADKEEPDGWLGGRPTSRRTVIKGAIAAVGVGGLAAGVAIGTESGGSSRHHVTSTTVTGSSPAASTSSPSRPRTGGAAAATRIDLGDARYKAKGDGSDDTPALMAWRDDIHAAIDRGARGVLATVPCGVFSLGGGAGSLDILDDNVHLQGDGRGGSVLTQMGRSNLDVVQTRGYGTFSDRPRSGFSITDLTIDGNSAAQTQARWCLVINGFNYDIETVDLLHGGAGAFSSRYHDNGTAKYQEARIRGLGCHEYAAVPGSRKPTYGILWAGPHDSQFSDMILSTLAAAQPGLGPSYGFVQTKDASAEYLTNTHIWGRHHYGLWADPVANGIHLANVVAEGAFLANAVLGNGCTWSGGEVYGTNGNSGTQPHEQGITLGMTRGASRAPSGPGITDGFTGSSNYIQGIRVYNFSAPGVCINFRHGAGNNVVSAVCATALGNGNGNGLYAGSPQHDDEVFLIDSSSSARLIQRLGST
jgi:hypothetical protein